MTGSLPEPDFSRLGPQPGFRLAVTGGCGGIGRRLVEVALAQGLRVADIDLPQSLERHGPPPEAAAIPYDARSEDETGAAFEALGKHWDGELDGLVHLPGYMTSDRHIDELSMEEIDDILNVNLRSSFLAARASLPLFRKAGGGAMVFAASGLATLVEKNTAAYSASKAGVIALAKGLAKENAPDIRANVIAPGAVDTAFLRGGTGRGGDESNAKDMLAELGHGQIMATIPLGRIAVVDDIVGPILFLLGDKSRFMTGQTMHINGGRQMI